MKGVIDTELDEVTFKTLKGPLIVKMGQLPGKEYEVETNKRLTVGPNQEMVTKVELKSSVNIISKNLVFRPTQDVNKINGLIGTAAISKANDKKEIYVRFFNLTNHTITIKKKTTNGHCKQFGEHDVVSFVDEKVEESITISRKQVYHTIWEALDLENENNALSYEERKDIVRLFCNHHPVLAINPEDVGHVKGMSIRIHKGDAKPIKNNANTYRESAVKVHCKNCNLAHTALIYCMYFSTALYCR